MGFFGYTRYNHFDTLSIYIYIYIKCFVVTLTFHEGAPDKEKAKTGNETSSGSTFHSAKTSQPTSADRSGGLLISTSQRNQNSTRYSTENTLKVSYSCMPNVASIIKAHNKQISATDDQTKPKTCNCRKKECVPPTRKLPGRQYHLQCQSLRSRKP